jgi:hypothetical protein
MSELTLPEIGTYAFGEDVTLEEAATELRSKLKPEYVGTPYEGIYNRIVDLSVERADPTQFAIDRTLLGEAYAGIRRGISGTLGSAIRGIEEIPEALLNEELFGNYLQDAGAEFISDTLRDYKPGRDYEWAGGLGEAVGSAGTFLTAGLIGAGVGAGALALAPAAGISSAIGGALVAGGLGVLVAGDEAYQRAVAEGADPEQLRYAVGLSSAILGPLEALPTGRLVGGLLGRIGITAGSGRMAGLTNQYRTGQITDAEYFSRMDNIRDEVGTLRAYVTNVATDAGLEGSQEALAAIGQNVIERYIYNPDQRIVNFEDIEQGLYGGGAGAILSGITSIFKVRGDVSRVEREITREQDANTQARSNIGNGVEDPNLRAQIDNLPGITARTLSEALNPIVERFGVDVALEAMTGAEEVGEKLIIPTALPDTTREQIKNILGADNVVMEESTGIKQLISNVRPVSTASALFQKAQERARAREKAKLEADKTTGLPAVPAEISNMVNKTGGSVKYAEDLVNFQASLVGQPSIDPAKALSSITEATKNTQKKLNEVLPEASVFSPGKRPKGFVRQVDALYGAGTSDKIGLSSLTGSAINPDATINQDYMNSMDKIITLLEGEKKKRDDIQKRIQTYKEKLGLASEQESIRNQIEAAAKTQALSEKQKNINSEINKLAGDDVNIAFGNASRVQNMYDRYRGEAPSTPTVGGFVIGTGESIMLNKDAINKDPASAKLLVGEEAFHVAQIRFLTQNEKDILDKTLTPELAEANGIDLSSYPDPQMKRMEAQAKLAAKYYAEGADSITGLRPEKKGFIRRILDKIKKGIEGIVRIVKKNNMETEYQSVDQILRAFTEGALARPSEARKPLIVESKNLSQIYANNAQGPTRTLNSTTALNRFMQGQTPSNIKSWLGDLFYNLYGLTGTMGDFFAKYEGLKPIAQLTRKIQAKFDDVILKVEEIAGTAFLEKLNQTEKTTLNGFLDAVNRILQVSTENNLTEQDLRAMGVTNTETIRKILSGEDLNITDFFGQDIIHQDPSLQDQKYRIDPNTPIAKIAEDTRKIFDYLFDEKLDAYVLINLAAINDELTKDNYLNLTLDEIKTNPESLKSKLDQLNQNNETKRVKDIEDTLKIYNEAKKQKRLMYFPSLRNGRYGFKYKFRDARGVERTGFKVINDTGVTIKSLRRNAGEFQKKFFLENSEYKKEGDVFEVTYDNFIRENIDASDSFMIQMIFDSAIGSTELSSKMDENALRDLRSKFIGKLSQSVGKRLLPKSTSVYGYLTRDNRSTYLSENFNNYVSSQANLISRMPDNIQLQKEITKAKSDRSIPEPVIQQVEKVWGKDGYLTEEHRIADKFKRGAFVWWLGYNLSSAMVNLVGLVHTTMPYIMAIAKNPAEGTQALIKGVKLAMMMTKRMPFASPEKVGMSRVLQFLDFANKPFDFTTKPDGMPQDIFDMLKSIQPSLNPIMLSDFTGELTQQGLRRNTKAGRAFDIALRGAGFAFAWVETFNRVTTAIAAYETYKKNPEAARRIYEAEGVNKFGEFNAENFTKFSVEKAQFKFDKTERPAYNRGPIGGVVTQFLPYQVNVMRYFFGALRAGIFGASGVDAQGNPRKLDPETRKIYQKMALISSMAFIAGGGLIGMPLAAITGDLISMIISAFGGDEEDPEKMLTDMFNSFGLPQEISAALAYRGLPSLVGVEIGKRTGIEGPRSLFNNVFGNQEASLSDFFGPAGGILGQASNFFRRYNSGDEDIAFMELLPPVFRNIALASMGSRRVTLAGRELPVEAFGGIDFFDTIVQASGFTPTAVVEARNSQYQQNMMERNYTRRGERFRNEARNTLVDLYTARAEGDQEAVRDLQEDIRAIQEAVNESRRENPSEPFSFDLKTIARYASDDFLRRQGIQIPVREMPKVIRPQYQEALGQFGWRYQPQS